MVSDTYAFAQEFDLADKALYFVPEGTKACNQLLVRLMQPFKFLLE